MRKHFETASRGKLNHGQLIKSGQRYYIRYMDHNDLQHNLRLQQHVLDVLKGLNKTHYIIEKSEAFLRKLLDNGHAIIGTFVNDHDPNTEDRLGAHMLVVYPHNEYETGLADPDVLPHKNLDKISVVSNVLVHQDFRGNHLMHTMLDEWVKIATADGKSDAIAEVCADNQFSWAVFLECGFVIYEHGHDDRDGSDLVYVHLPLDRDFVYSPDPKETVRIRLFDAQAQLDPAGHDKLRALLKQGYHGLDFNRRTGMLTLSKCVGSVPKSLPSASPALPRPSNDNGP